MNLVHLVETIIQKSLILLDIGKLTKVTSLNERRRVSPQQILTTVMTRTRRR